MTVIQVAVEGVIAGVVAYFTPEDMRMPVDRGVVFVTVLMILQLAWMLRHRVSGVTSAICAGFALYGSVATAAVFVQGTAIEHRNSAAFTAAGYAKGLVYIAVVVFWIV